MRWNTTKTVDSPSPCYHHFHPRVGTFYRAARYTRATREQRLGQTHLPMPLRITRKNGFTRPEQVSHVFGGAITLRFRTNCVLSVTCLAMSRRCRYTVHHGHRYSTAHAKFSTVDAVAEHCVRQTAWNSNRLLVAGLILQGVIAPERYDAFQVGLMIWYAGRACLFGTIRTCCVTWAFGRVTSLRHFTGAAFGLPAELPGVRTSPPQV